jgi:hypothetical protein
MSVEAMAVVLHHSRASGTTKLVLLGIANHAGDGGAWPTVGTLAKYANVSERAVQQAIGKLVKLGELSVARQAGGLGYLKHYERPNRYDVLVTCPATCDRSMNHRQRAYPQARQLTLIPSDSATSDPVKQGSPGEAEFTRSGEAGFTQTSPTNPPVDHSPRTVTRPRARAARPEHRAAMLEQIHAALDEAKAKQS